MSQIGPPRQCGVIVVSCILGLLGPFQGAGAPQSASDTPSIDRGRYLVEGIGVCWNCHTPRTESGELDRSRWLFGGPVVFEPPVPTPGWAQVAPRLAGLPPGTDEQFITLMMTGIARTGAPPRPPMPRFHMTRGDATSVLAYLKSLKPME